MNVEERKQNAKREERNKNQKVVLEKLLKAIFSNEAEEVKVVYQGTHWEINGERLEGVPAVSVSPSRLFYIINHMKEVKSAKSVKTDHDFTVEVCLRA